MDSLKMLMKQEKKHELLLFVVLVVYILFNKKTPECIAKYIDNIYGQIVVVLLAFTVFVSTNPIVGVLAFFAAYEFIRRSSAATGIYGIESFTPTEEKKAEVMKAMNPEPVLTLEEELVEKLAPISPNKVVGLNDEGSFQPVLNDLHGAVAPDFDGVI
jgi:hypothetical protein